MRFKAVRSKKQMTIEHPIRLRELCGPTNMHLRVLEQGLAEYALCADSNGSGICLEGIAPGPELAEQALDALVRRMDAGNETGISELEGIVSCLRGGAPVDYRPVICPLMSVNARSAGQYAYLEDLRNRHNELIFGIGPAGTGKTFLAVAVGTQQLLAGAHDRLVLARPAVEAGEKLGFLPGDIENKTDPYMLPIMDALHLLIGADELARRKARGEIEFAPLAFMRGRTFNNAFIIVDEAQNASIAQMRMALTRLGDGSRIVVTGDPSQTDLPSTVQPGLARAVTALRDIRGVHISQLTASDIVRHRLVAEIIKAWPGQKAELA